ncbi:MAG: DUF115 domain-containing protein [Treponema sp.]|jgi:hypothetical protein|nr:DUF115 domain-containing protein [Treponema sp.]
MMEGRPLVRNGKTILSSVDPVRRAERVADAVPISDKTLYVCPSPVYGYGLEKLLSRLAAEAPNSALLCVEADPELYEIARNNIDPHLLESARLLLTNVCENGKLCAFVRKTWGSRAFRRVETVRLTGGWQLYPGLYDSLCEALRREIASEWGNALTLAKLGRLYIRNALRNLALLPRRQSVASLSYGDTPVLVLGAGPSMDETLDALGGRFGEDCKEPAKRGFRIICADTCLPALRDRDITPDLAVILESQHWNLRDFIGCRGWKVPFAADLSALPESQEILSGEGFLFFTPWTPLRIFERLKAASLLPALVPPLGSVGLSAVEIARRLTGGAIICAGLDFSFSLDKYHARSTPGHKEKLAAQTRFHGLFNMGAYGPYAFSALSKSGCPVRSNPGLENYRNVFEEEFSGGTRMFDIAGSGLPLGLKTLSLEDALPLLAAPLNHGEEHGKKKKTVSAETVFSFLNDEKKRLLYIRDILTGSATAQESRLGALIGECDYLWAHFPDYSGGLRPDVSCAALKSPSALSFLKRLRAEIDPALALIERVMNECGQ